MSSTGLGSGGATDAVVQYLAARGVPPGRLRAIGYGDTRPIADNANEDGRARNRRVAIVVHPKGVF